MLGYDLTVRIFRKMEDNTKEKTFQTILELYDVAESLLNAVEEQESDSPQESIDMIEPVIEQIVESADILADKYYRVIKEEQALSERDKFLIETALKKAYFAIDNLEKKSDLF